MLQSRITASLTLIYQDNLMNGAMVNYECYCEEDEDLLPTDVYGHT